MDPVSLGPYALHGLLGQGAMGKVYAATHTSLKRKVALKVLPANYCSDPARVARFVREMEAVGRLDHPNIVRATDAGEFGGTYFIAMEFIEGIDVEDLASKGRLDRGVACEIVRQAAAGLQHIQENGLVHRDIKPSNLMVTKQGVVKILDLGIARLREDNEVGTLTADGGLMGTPDYIAPEQVLDLGNVDIRADIYSLGCTLYRLLSGRPPFDGPSYSTNMAKVVGHTQKEPTPISEFAEISPEMAAVVQRMMSKDRENRFQSPAEVVATMCQWANGNALPNLATNFSSATESQSTGASSQPVQAQRLADQQIPIWRFAAVAAIMVASLIGGGGYLLGNLWAKDTPVAKELVQTVSRTPTTSTIDQREQPNPQTPTEPAPVVVDRTAVVDTPDSTNGTPDAVSTDTPREGTNVAESNTASIVPQQPESIEVPTTDAISIDTPLSQSSAEQITDSVQQIEENTKEISETLKEIRDQARTYTAGQVVAEPQTDGEIYHNARTYAEQGKQLQARRSYLKLVNHGSPYVDVHRDFQQLLIVQEGIARAREIYMASITRENITPATELALVLLQDPNVKQRGLMSMVKRHPNFAPAVYELANLMAKPPAQQTNTQQTQEIALLKEVRRLHERGELVRHYLDPHEAARIMESVEQRLQAHEGIADSARTNPVRITFLRHHRTWTAALQITEPCLSISYSIDDGETFKETGEGMVFDPRTGQVAPRKSFAIPASRAPEAVLVKYVDQEGKQRGPFRVPFDHHQEEAKNAKRIAELSKYSWLRFGEGNNRNRLYFTTLLAFRKQIEEVRYGVDVNEPNATRDIQSPSDCMMEIPATSKFAVIQVTFRDGTKSEVVRIDRE